LFHKALGNERRVYILYLLWKFGPHTGVELVEKLVIHPSAVSRHLHVLLKAGLLVGQRKGMEVYFSIAPTKVIITVMQEIEELTFSSIR
jgi:DNA-binding transcriptional ArsR family regulator